MTYKEKLMKEHPEKYDYTIQGYYLGCPEHYGYELKGDCSGDCEACWEREIPGTEKPAPPKTGSKVNPPESLYPKVVIHKIDIDIDDLVDKCIQAKRRLIHEGDCKPSEAVLLVNSMLRMRYGYISEEVADE